MKRETDIKFAKCLTCPGMMSDAIPGKCWKCVLTGRAFMLPEALERYPVIDPTSDTVIDAQEARHERLSRQGPVVVEMTTIVAVAEPKISHQRFGQTKLADELLSSGMTFEQVVEEIKKRLPLYPADKIPQLVRIRISGLTKK